MKSITTGVAVFALALGLNALAPIGGHATISDSAAGIVGPQNDIVQQSAPGCARNPPPTRC